MRALESSWKVPAPQWTTKCKMNHTSWRKGRLPTWSRTTGVRGGGAGCRGQGCFIMAGKTPVCGLQRSYTRCTFTEALLRAGWDPDTGHSRESSRWVSILMQQTAVCRCCSQDPGGSFSPECALGPSLRAASGHRGPRKCPVLPLKAPSMLGREGPRSHTQASLGGH